MERPTGFLQKTARESGTGSLSPEVWELSARSSGMMARFVTDSDQIAVKWQLISPTLATNHMAATGVSGIDLYVKHDDKWHWLGIGRPDTQENESILISDMSPERREYALYLPLYNGVNSVEIGLSENASFERAPVRHPSYQAGGILRLIDHPGGVRQSTRDGVSVRNWSPYGYPDHQPGFLRKREVRAGGSGSPGRA